MKSSTPLSSFRQLPILGLLALLTTSTSHAGTINQGSGNSYVAFDALTATLIGGAPESWGSSNIVEAAGGSALYSSGTNSTGDSPHSFAHYQIQFKTAGTYNLYYRWRADVSRTAGDNATANSCWIGSTWGAYRTPGDQTTYYRSDSNNQSAPADNTFAWRMEPAVTYVVGAAELANPVVLTIGTREAGMTIDRLVFSSEAGLTDVQLESMTYTMSQVVQGASDTYAAFSADGPVTLIAGTPETWVSSNIVDAAGGTALYTSGTTSTGDSPHGFAQYQIVFRTAGAYSLYYRWKADATRTAGDNATANSCWVGSTWGAYSTPADQTTYFRTDSNNALAPADNTFAWRMEPTASYTVAAAELAGPVTLTIGTREAGMTIDRVVFSTDATLTAVQLDSLADSGTAAPAPEIVNVAGNAGLNGITVRFSRPLAAATVSNGDFKVAPAVTVTAAAVDATDARIVRLTTGTQTQATRYTLSVTGVSDTSGTPIKAGASMDFTAWKRVKGWAKKEVYMNLTGTTVAELYAAPSYPDNPDTVQFVRGFQIPLSGTLANYGARLTANFSPASGGAFDFFVNNDDEAEVFLSSDSTEGNLASLGVMPLHAAPFAEGTMVSSPSLAVGQDYLLCGVVKQGGGDATLQLAVRGSSATTPDAATLPILAGDLISTMVNPDLGVVTFDRQPADATVAVGSRARFAVKANTLSSPVYYQWQLNGADIPGATRPSFVTTPLAMSDSGKTYQVVVSVAGISTTSRAATLTVTPGSPSNLQPYLGVSFIGAGYVSDDAVSLSASDVAGVVEQANWNNLDGSLGPVDLMDANGAPSPVSLTLNTSTGVTAPLGMWSSGTRSLLNGDGDLMEGFIHNGTSNDPILIGLANVPAGNYQVILYTLGFDFQANYQTAYSVTGAGSYPTYHVLGETGLDYTQNPSYRRMSSTDRAARQKGNYVQFDSVSPTADGSLTLSVAWEATAASTYNPAINGFQLVKVLPVTAKPTLGVKAATGQLALTWDAAAAGFTLQSSAALGAGAAWTPVTGAANPLTGAGSRNVPTSAPASYYRLVK